GIFEQQGVVKVGALLRGKLQFLGDPHADNTAADGVPHGLAFSEVQCGGEGGNYFRQTDGTGHGNGQHIRGAGEASTLRMSLACSRKIDKLRWFPHVSTSGIRREPYVRRNSRAAPLYGTICPVRNRGEHGNKAYKQLFAFGGAGSGVGVCG